MRTPKTAIPSNLPTLRKNLAGLLLMVVLVEMGEKMAEQFLPIYLLAIGGGVFSIGLLSGMDNLLSALYSFPGGYLSDRLGYKNALISFNVLAIFGYAIVLIVPSWQAVLVGAVFFISWSAISLPATVSLVSQTLPSNRHTMGISLHSLVRRLPMALGPIVGGILITAYGETVGIRYTFLVAIILCTISLVIQQRLIQPGSRSLVPQDSNPLRLVRSMPLHLRQLLITDILVRFCEQIPYAFVVVWAINHVGITAAEFGLLRAVEMVTAVLIYIPVAYLADRSTKRPYVGMTLIFFTMFPVILLAANSFLALVLAFIVRGLKEFGEPSRKALIMELAPADNKASYFGAYYLARDLLVSIGAFGGAILWAISPQANFTVAFGFGVLSVLFFLYRYNSFLPAQSRVTN